MNCRLIVNADDMGILSAINEGIIQCHLEGIVTSASVMANGRAFLDAIARIQTVPSLDIGVHLTLVEETPVLGVEEVPSLVERSGRFHKTAYQFLTRMMFGRIDLEEVEKELDAQIRRVMDHGISISHLDSHQHVHTLPGISRIVSRLAEKYGIAVVRIPRESLTMRMFKIESLKRFVELVVVNIVSMGMNRVSSNYAADLVGFYDGGHLDRVALEKVITGLKPEGVYELMCHPGHEEKDSPYEHWKYSPTEELKALTAPEIKTLLRDRKIELTTYSALEKMRHS